MQVQECRTFMGRFESKVDLLEALTDICKKENIKLGFFSIIGAVVKANVGYYNQATRKYIESAHLDKNLEITSCLGNISLKDSEISIHAHISLSDDSGRTYGGHLVKGCVVFAGEYYIKEFSGAGFERGYDEETGLSLWSI